MNDHSPFQMIPAAIDLQSIRSDLHAWGWCDHKIEIAAGLGQGYINHVRNGSIREPSYQKAARLYNFWVSELEQRKQQGLSYPRMQIVTFT